jgi:urease accessory protein
MIRATRVFPMGEWAQPAAESITLDHGQRHRRRMAMTGEGGLAFLLDLAEALPLRDGDGLLLEDGRIVEVRAAPEALAEITMPAGGDLVRIAWHLGNRHLPAELGRERIRIRHDHVIEEMVERLGARVVHVTAPFDPESGAYHAGPHDDGHHGHGHRHNPALDHDDRLEDEDPTRG